MLAAFLPGGGSTAGKAVGGAAALIVSGVIATFYKAVFFTTPHGYATIVERAGKMRVTREGTPLIRREGRNRRIPLVDVQRVINLQEYAVPFEAFHVDRKDCHNNDVNWLASGMVKFRIIDDDTCIERSYYGGEGNLEQDVVGTARAALKAVLKQTPTDSLVTDDVPALTEAVNEKCEDTLRERRGVLITSIELGDDSRSQAQVTADAIAARMSTDGIHVVPFPAAS